MLPMNSQNTGSIWSVPPEAQTLWTSCYTVIKYAYRSVPHEALGLSDHCLLHVIPSYKQKLKTSKPVVRTYVRGGLKSHSRSYRAALTEPFLKLQSQTSMNILTLWSYLLLLMLHHHTISHKSLHPRTKWPQACYPDICGHEVLCEIGAEPAEGRHVLTPDPLQFAYQATDVPNRSADDAVNVGLHNILQHLNSPGTYTGIPQGCFHALPPSMTGVLKHIF